MIAATTAKALTNREENMRRARKSAKLLTEHGSVVFFYLVSPLADFSDEISHRLS